MSPPQPCIIIMQSSLHPLTSTTLTKEAFTKVKTIWQSLQDNNDSLQFRNPVDWQEMGLLDYLNFVKQPMDLSTVHRKLRQGKYRTVQQALDDIQLIWDNCKVYNQSNSWIYNLADKLEKHFKKMVKSYLPQVQFQGQSTPAPTIKQPIQNAITSKKQEQQQVEEEEVPYSEKSAFVSALSDLGAQQLKCLVDIIQQMCPVALKQLQGGKKRIMVDLLDLRSIRMLKDKQFQLRQQCGHPSKKIKYI